MPKAIQCGDTDIAEFYERHYKLVYRLCFTYLKNSADAEDCTEDVFVKVLTVGYTFNDEAHEKKWLTVTTINLCKDRLKHWWHRQVGHIDDYDPPDEEAPLIDETLAAVLRLPDKYKDVLYLHYYMDYKTDEIAALLKKPPSTVRNHLREAREVLRRQLGGKNLEE